ncbi:MAG: hypothetical protein IPN95_29050 [Bacteroidetes bacterium]|nr:hypothetical protein [Bacteroidota bacterium]MBP6720804.1 hypothetical protein [Bacteroidia bacterium]
MVSICKSLFLGLGFLFLIQTLPASTLDEEVQVADDVHLTGILGTKIRIDMVLQLETGKYFFNNSGTDNIDVRGKYFYRTQLKPIPLNGTLSPSKGLLMLTVGDNENPKERFEGRWDPKLKKVTGNWTLTEPAKTMPFVLTAAEANVKSSAIVSYFAVLRELLQAEPDAEGAKIDDAQWEAPNGTITNFAPNWGGGIDVFTPTRLEYYTSYNSTARSSDYTEIYQLLPSEAGVFVVHFSTYTGFEKSYDENDEMSGGISGSSCGYELTVYKYADGAVDVTKTVLPADVKSTGGSESDTEDISCDGQVLSDAILLPSGEKLYWDGTKFVK